MPDNLAPVQDNVNKDSLLLGQIHDQSQAKNTKRAFCRVVLNAMEAGIKYIERSLNDFHTDGKPLEGRSIIIIDKKTEELLRKPSPGSK
nr:hypothetical protein [Endozoicomonas sp.]